MNDIPKRPLGSTGETVSLLGVGGAHIGHDSLTDGEATRLVRTAFEAGITFFDCAREYFGGRSEERLGRGLAGIRDQVFLMTKNCGHRRAGDDSRKSLEESLSALKTDRIDLWLFHEVIHPDDPDWIFERGGLEAALEAKKAGKIRYIGFSGHKDPRIHLEMIKRFPWDAVLMPLNVLDAHFRSFEQQVLPELLARQMAPLAMKSLGGDGLIPQATGLSVADCLRYTLSLPISVLISGMDSLEVLRQNLAVAQGFQPLDPEERERILKKSAPFAQGRFEEYKTSDAYDGDPGRRAHGL